MRRRMDASVQLIKALGGNCKAWGQKPGCRTGRRRASGALRRSAGAPLASPHTITARSRKENVMKSNPVAESIGEESPTFAPESGIGAKAGTLSHGTEPPDEDAQEEDSEPGEPPSQCKRPRTPVTRKNGTNLQK